MEVRDWGRGFDPGQAGDGRGIGLLSMRERVKLMGGELRVRSRPDEGTNIVADLPVDLPHRAEPANGRKAGG